MKRIAFIVALLSSSLWAQTTTTITGTIKDLTNVVVTSGKVTFTLTPNRDTTISGIARFTPTTITCLINGSGLIKAQDGVSTCTLTMNTALSPAGTYYTVAVWPYGVKTASFNFYAVLSTYDWSTVVPTPATSPAQNFADVYSNQTIGGNKTFTGSTTFTGSFNLPSECNANGPLDVVACYGADPTGVSDSASALSAAFAAVSNAERRIPAGVYKINSPVTIDTRYSVIGANAENTVIQAGAGFAGSQMVTVVTSAALGAQTIGTMSNLFWDCQGRAGIGVMYGGSGTFFTEGYTTISTTFHNCTTDAGQVGANTWLLTWINVDFQGSAEGLRVLDAANNGENLNAYGGCWCNNTGAGLFMGPATLAQHDIHLHSVSFDLNGSWAIQNQTAATGDSLVDLEGGYIFQHAKYISNFGRMTINGAFFGDGSSSGTLGYLIDNEGLMQAFGGRWTNSGGGVFLNPAQTGISNCYSVPGLPNNNCNSWVDGTSSGNALFGGLTLGGNLALAAKTVGALPAAASFTGNIYYVTDSTAIAAEGQNCVGGSTNKALAFSNGTVWKCF